jgi:hypothetical protein
MSKKRDKKGKENLDEDKKKEKEKNPTMDAAKDLSKLAAAAGSKKATAVSGDSKDKDPEPAGDRAAPAEMATKGSEKFSLMNAAPF